MANNKDTSKCHTKVGESGKVGRAEWQESPRKTPFRQEGGKAKEKRVKRNRKSGKFAE